MDKNSEFYKRVRVENGSIVDMDSPDFLEGLLLDKELKHSSDLNIKGNKSKKENKVEKKEPNYCSSPFEQEYLSYLQEKSGEQR